ncbi:MAG: hypothetical protein E6K38_06860 [Gammaproteobacteria bacterium]|nr:MAG: hypothetical protein E6K38_06860 [Gammaproteobacteria bacterium]
MASARDAPEWAPPPPEALAWAPDPRDAAAWPPPPPPWEPPATAIEDTRIRIAPTAFLTSHPSSARAQRAEGNLLRPAAVFHKRGAGRLSHPLRLP